jgi:site-specific DNA recombinase
VTKFYVDESKSGSKIEGRDAFNQMIVDAAKDQFNVVVVYKIDRLARDGVDILSTAKVLKSTFQVHTVSTADAFDTRNPSNALMNHVQAGVAEDERLRILERTIKGRISRAKEGKPWTRNCSVGRSYDKKTGKWSINDQGRMIATVLQRYLNGTGVAELSKEFGFSNNRVSTWVKNGQLTGTYKAHFRCKDLGLEETIEVPAIPAIISQAMLDKVKARLSHRRTHNRVAVTKYSLSGFI